MNKTLWLLAALILGFTHLVEAQQPMKIPLVGYVPNPLVEGSMASTRMSFV
jgi:hypothetical protein